MEIIDLSFTLENGMPTCGTHWHQKVKIQQMGTLDKVGRNTHRIVLGSHSGTHMDAPMHFIHNGNTIEQIRLDILCGGAAVIDLTQFGQGDVVPAEAFRDIEVSKRMIFKFEWHKKWKTSDYYVDFPYFTENAVRYLIERGMRFMAIDTPSPDCGSAIGDTKNDSPNHRILLKNEIVIVEYLNNTDKLKPDKTYEITALPLKVQGSDGCPCRVIAREVM